MDKSVRNNLTVMFGLLSDGGGVGLSAVIWAILFTVGVYISVTNGILWFIYLFTVINIISNIGLTSLLNNMCDPYTIKEFIDNRKLNDSEVAATYSHLKRPRWVIGMQQLAYVAEVYILMSGGLFYIGLIWLVNYTMIENNLYNNTKKMKLYWEEYSADDRAIQE